MYVRFWRWASDRLREDGVIAFITNRNFIEKVAFDGFRLSVAEEFAECWLMDLGGDVRANPKISGTKHNVFGIQTGVTIAFMVRKKAAKGFGLFYARRPEDETRVEKLAFLDSVQDFARWEVDPLKPDAKGNWLSGEHADWASYLPLADPSKGPLDRDGAKVEAIFRLSSNGAETRRDDWLWGADKLKLKKKVKGLLALYAHDVQAQTQGPAVKWDSELDKAFYQRRKIEFSDDHMTGAIYRVFGKTWLYFDPLLNGRVFRLPNLFRPNQLNPAIAFRSVASEDQLAVVGVDRPFDQGLVKTGNGRTQGVTRYRYLKSGERIDNITPWALAQFRKRYPGETVTPDTIFAYCYAVLHDPLYRTKHADDLRREFPRIPLYAQFARWVAWGEALLKLHIGYEKVRPWKLERIDAPGELKPGTVVRPILRSDRDNGAVTVDARTRLTGIPAQAWDYKLGNRSGIDWVLDQHKEKKIKDPTVAAKFNTYRFADYKQSMIDLLARVVRVSVETVAITEAMKALDRSGWDETGGG